MGRKEAFFEKLLGSVAASIEIEKVGDELIKLQTEYAELNAEIVLRKSLTLNSVAIINQ